MRMRPFVQLTSFWEQLPMSCLSFSLPCGQIHTYIQDLLFIWSSTSAWSFGAGPLHRLGLICINVRHRSQVTRTYPLVNKGSIFQLAFCPNSERVNSAGFSGELRQDEMFVWHCSFWNKVSVSLEFWYGAGRIRVGKILWKFCSMRALWHLGPK